MQLLGVAVFVWKVENKNDNSCITRVKFHMVTRLLYDTWF